jgi:hypothetical protein
MPIERPAAVAAAAAIPPGLRTMLDRLRHFETEEGRTKGLSFRPEPTDVAISTSPKVRQCARPSD